MKQISRRAKIRYKFFLLPDAHMSERENRRDDKFRKSRFCTSVPIFESMPTKSSFDSVRVSRKSRDLLCQPDCVGQSEVLAIDLGEPAVKVLGSPGHPLLSSSPTAFLPLSMPCSFLLPGTLHLPPIHAVQVGSKFSSPFQRRQPCGQLENTSLRNYKNS